MSSAKVAAACVLAALLLSACGVAAKPEAGSAAAASISQKNVNDSATKHVKCLRQDHIGYRLFTRGGYPWIQVGTRPSGPTIDFTATPGAAQDEQIKGQAQGAEVIGSALVYPNQAGNALMTKVEACMTIGVKS